LNAIDDEEFVEFHQAMGEDVESEGVDELVQRFTAWKLYSKVYTDPVKIKSLVMKATRKRDMPTCGKCGRKGHTTERCYANTNYNANANFNNNVNTTIECFSCGERGHIRRDCPRRNGTVAAKQGKVYQVSVESEDEDEDEEKAEISYAYKASSFRAEKRKAEDDDKERKKSSKKTNVKTVDTDVVNFFKELKIPFQLVARHGASLESQAKRAIKLMYDEGRERRKTKTNPIITTANLSHALIVEGKLDKTLCRKLVIDPGCSISLLDVNKAREAGIGIRKKSRVRIELANGEIEVPIGETARKEPVNIGGVEVQLRMPVVDAKSSYDILLGRDWLHAVSAVGNYRRNSYIISKDGNEITLAGKTYDTTEVELPENSQDSSVENEKERESSYYDSDDEGDGIEVIVEKAYRANIWKLTDMDIHPRNIENDECDTLALKKNEADWPRVDGCNPNKESASEYTDKNDETDESDVLVPDENGVFDLSKAKNATNPTNQPKPQAIEWKIQTQAYRLLIEQLDTIDINPKLNDEQFKQVKELIWNYRDVFANSLNEMAITNLAEHEINLKPGARPYYCPGFKRFPQPELKFIKEELERELSANKIIEYDGPWCAPITIAKKKNGDFRKCVAYNGLNDRTERESWPLPNIEELLERMAGYNWYSACDGFSGYFSVRIRSEDIPKTMFRTPYGTFAYLVMPFGLKNAPHTYSKVTAKAFAQLIGKSVEAYIDDTGTYSFTFEDHLQDLAKTFDAALKANIHLKASKCHFCYPEIEFVGHLVGARGIRMMPDKVTKINEWPVPSNKTEL
jgi:hypothetical protein